MSDDIRNLDLFIKIMAMTTSDNDNIALTAMRRANAMLAREGKGWDEVLRGAIKITIVEDPFKNMSVPQQPTMRQPPSTPAYAPQTPPRPDPAEIARRQRAAEEAQRRAEAAKRQREADAKAAAAAKRHGERPNQYEGTCVHCANKVTVGNGIAFHNGVMWKVKHRPNECPTPQPGRRRKATFTIDDLAF
jgi:type IV secretory pathway VirB10-like protein